MVRTTRLHIVTGDKGNVGKSAWCAAMIEYYRQHANPLQLVDADGDSQSLSAVYPSAFPLMLSDDIAYAHLADSIYEIAYGEAHKKAKAGDVLVDLPAGGEKFINKWIDECAITERAEEDNISLFKWWVCDSDARSIEMFEASVEKYPSIKHILLKNMGRSAPPQWVSFNANENIEALSDAEQIKILEIPGIPPAVLSELRESKVKLVDVMEDADYKRFGLSKGMRVRGWVRNTSSLLSSVIPLRKRRTASKPAPADNPSVVEGSQSDAETIKLEASEPDASKMPAVA